VWEKNLKKLILLGIFLSAVADQPPGDRLTTVMNRRACACPLLRTHIDFPAPKLIIEGNITLTPLNSMKTRREFLSIAAGAAGAICLANAGQQANAQGLMGRIRRTPLGASAAAPVTDVKATWKVGITDWDLRASGRLSSFAVAKELGYEGVQVSYQPSGDESLSNKANRPRFLAAAKEAGVAISSFCIGDFNGRPFATTPEAETWVEDCIDAMEEMDVPHVLIPFFGNGDIDTNDARKLFPAVIEKFKRLAPIAERKKKVLAIESYLTAEAHLGLVSAIGSDAVTVYYDTLNTRHRGSDIYHEIELLGSRKLISEIHFKDDARLGAGEIDFTKVRDLLEKIGYEGWIIVESSVTGDWREALAANGEFTKKLIGR